MAEFNSTILPFHHAHQDRFSFMNSNHHTQTSNGTNGAHLNRAPQDDLQEDRVRVDRRLFERLVDGNQDGACEAGEHSTIP